MFPKTSRRLRFLHALRGAGCALALATVAADAQDAAPANVIVIIDGSGSMWGKLDGEKLTKLVQSRDAVKATVGQLPAGTRMGLASFGHRRSGDCNDAQILVPPEQGAPARLNQPLDKLNPRGRGPLTLAVRTAARALSSMPGTKAIVLVHDDPDNCIPDPCGALSDLPTSSPGVAVHVVGLGLKGEEAQRLQCLTRSTGGRHFDAQSGTQVSAAIGEALRLASNAQVPAPLVAEPKRATPPQVATPQPQRPQPAQTPGRQPLATSGPPAMRLALLLAANGQPINRPVRWTISRAEGDGGAVVFAGTGQDILLPIAAGTYVVEARDGLAQARTSVTVAEKGHTPADLVWNGGIVRLARLAPGSDDGGYLLTLRPPASTSEASSAVRPTAIGRLDGGEAVVPSGRHLLRIERDRSFIEHTIDVAPGAIITVDAPQLPGSIALAAARQYPAVGAAPQIWSVLEDDPDAPQGRREIARSGAAMPQFHLPPGTYTVQLRQGHLEVREHLSVVAGESVARTLDLAPATLTLVSELVGSGAASADAVIFRVERVDTPGEGPMLAHARNPVIAVNAGRYRVETLHGNGNARAVREIELTAGQTAIVRFEHRAGTLRLAASSAQTYWDIRDANGRQVWSTSQSGQHVTLLEGRYTIRAETRDRRVESVVDVKAGEHREMALRE